MKERPILMTSENAQKCHDGQKTMTRRIVKLPHERGVWSPFFFEGSKCMTSDGKPGTDMACIANSKTGEIIACPYGQVGDMLWVRESISKPIGVDVTAKNFTGFYRATDPDRKVKWTPSIHMPRWACRTVLEITEIRVERLQAIGEIEARREGCAPCGHTSFHVDEHTCSFKALWESIHVPGLWAENPWVWVIGFKRVEVAI